QSDKLSESLPRVDQKVTEMTKALEGLDQASRRSDADIGVQLQKLMEDVASLRGQVDAYTHQLDALQAQGSAPAGKGGPAAPPGADIPRPADKKDFFALAQSKQKAGEVAVARQLYIDFTKKFPKDELSGEAHFQLAESYFVEDKCAEALPEYGQLVKGFPNSKSMPTALLHSADCFQRLKNLDAAQAALDQVIKRYPGTEAAKKAKARLAELKKAAAKPPPKK
ncbi:MAG TPA: tetratricopeptide repeat protein, partial [Myxococcaceae bacterium]|nr:tetratricopeptide repeat protein [Myxococcaceae bacterium]